MDAFSLHNIGVANFHLDGLDPFSFSLMGMLIVFVGLTFISLYIVALPKLLEIPVLLKRRKKSAGEGGTAQENALDAEKQTLLAIAVAFHLDQDFPEENQMVTWKSHGDDESAWQATGIAHGLSVRNHVHISRRRY